MADTLLNSIKLIVAVGSFVSSPGLLSGLKTGVSVLDTAKKVMAKPPPLVSALAVDLTADARAVFDRFQRDLPTEAEQLFAQMVEATLPDKTQIVADGMNPELIVTSMIGRLSDPEHRRQPMPELFHAITVPTLSRLMAEKSIADELTPASMAKVLGNLLELRFHQELVESRLETISSNQEHLNAQLAEREIEHQQRRTVQDFGFLTMTIGARGDRPADVTRLLQVLSEQELSIDDAISLLATDDRNPRNG